MDKGWYQAQWLAVKATSKCSQTFTPKRRFSNQCARSSLIFETRKRSRAIMLNKVLHSMSKETCTPYPPTPYWLQAPSSRPWCRKQLDLDRAGPPRIQLIRSTGPDTDIGDGHASPLHVQGIANLVVALPIFYVEDFGDFGEKFAFARSEVSGKEFNWGHPSKSVFN